MNKIIILPISEIKLEIQQAIRNEFDAIEKRRNRIEGVKLLTKNAVSLRLGKSFTTIKKLCENGTIKTTKSGLIEEAEIERYLSNT